MKISEVSEIYSMISSGIESISARRATISLRKEALNALNVGLIKVAFDTRRVDQEKDYIARRGLQNYNRSEQFITEATINRLKSLKILQNILNSLKLEYGHEQGWHDSYCRVLLDTINKSLRTDQKDGDFSEHQPGVGSFDYIEEMLFVRYRIVLASVEKMDESELKKILLSKDSELTNKDINHLMIEKSNIGKENYDSLLEKLFGGVKATKEIPEIERTITITIKDKII